MGSRGSVGGRGFVRVIPLSKTPHSVNAVPLPKNHLHGFRYRLPIPLLSVTMPVTMRITNPCGYTHPKNKPCRLCDAERRKLSGQKASLPSTNVVRAAMGGQVSQDHGNASSAGSPGSVAATSPDPPPVPPADTSTSDGPILTGEPTQHDEDFGIIRRSMTPAQKQKRHREKMGAEGRKRDRERKQRKRDGP